MVDVAIVSVLSATAVGMAGALAGPLTARGNRKHDRAMRMEESREAQVAELRDRRRVAYVEALAIAIAFRWMVVHEGKIENNPWPDARQDDLYRAGAQVQAWGSAPVIDLYRELIRDALAPGHVTDEVRSRVVALVEKLQGQIHAELCAVEHDLRKDEAAGTKVI